MKRLLAFLAVLVVGIVAGRLSNQGPVSAEGGGAGGTSCADVNNDGAVDISDVLYLCSNLFLGGPEPECADSEEVLFWIEVAERVQAELDACQAELAACQGGPCTGAEGRYIDNDDGTVTDCQTGLMWQKATAPMVYSWWEAGIYCENLELGGHDNWRLPTLDELRSLVDLDYRPTIDPVFDAEASWYWSSTSREDIPEDQAWLVNFALGLGLLDYKRDGHFVRAVRTAQ